VARVLIIDDDATTLRMLREMLRQAKFNVFTANSGADGIEAARQLNPDVVVLDLMMPEINGWDVCRAIRGFSNMPILVLSAVTDSQKVVHSLEAGADDYLVKPVPKGVLVAHINQLLDR